MTDNYIKPCPFCGEPPKIYTYGTWIEFACCVLMAFEKKTFLTPDEVYTFEPASGTYADDAEEKAYYAALNKWNTRRNQF